MPSLFHNDNAETKQSLTCPSTPAPLPNPGSQVKPICKAGEMQKLAQLEKLTIRSAQYVGMCLCIYTRIYLMIITSFQQQAMRLLQPKMILLFRRREICKSKVRERLHRAANIKKSQSGSQQQPAISGRAGLPIIFIPLRFK